MPFSTLAQENEAAHGLGRAMARPDRHKKRIVLYPEASAFFPLEMVRWVDVRERDRCGRDKRH